MQVIMEVDAVCAEKNISQKDENDVEMRTAPDVPDLSSRGSFHVSIPMKTTNNVDTNVNCNITLQDISSPKSSSKVNCLEYGIHIGTNQSIVSPEFVKEQEQYLKFYQSQKQQTAMASQLSAYVPGITEEDIRGA